MNIVRMVIKLLCIMLVIICLLNIGMINMMGSRCGIISSVCWNRFFMEWGLNFCIGLGGGFLVGELVCELGFECGVFFLLFGCLVLGGYYVLFGVVYCFVFGVGVGYMLLCMGLCDLFGCQCCVGVL